MKGFSIMRIHIITGLGLVLGMVIFGNYQSLFSFIALRFILKLTIAGYTGTTIGEGLLWYTKRGYLTRGAKFSNRLKANLFWDFGPPAIGMALALAVVWAITFGEVPEQQVSLQHQPVSQVKQVDVKSPLPISTEHEEQEQQITEMATEMAVEPQSKILEPPPPEQDADVDRYFSETEAGKDADVFFLQGLKEERIGHYDEARKYYQKSFKVHQNSHAQFRHGRILYESLGIQFRKKANRMKGLTMIEAAKASGDQMAQAYIGVKVRE